MMPVVGLSRTPASARTSGSRSVASFLERNFVGTSTCLENSWMSSRALSWVSSWATIHLPVLRCGMSCLAQRSYSSLFPRMQRCVLEELAP